MQECTLKAYAKINLGLDVTGRLQNGYHTVRMVMQSVGLYDELQFTRTESGIVITTDEAELPTDENNLIYKAARLMYETYSLQGGIKIHLDKHIPIAAGMAGGSTDAAATIKGICRLYDLDIPLEELMRISVVIGADVPYCILGGTALAEGIGEELTALPPAPNCVLLIAKPAINVSTKLVYETLDSTPYTNHPDIDGIVRSVKDNNLQGIVDRLGNVLEEVTVKLHPIISDLKNTMLAEGALGSLMSGSGPTVFGIFENTQDADKAACRIRSEYGLKQVYVTSFV